MGNMEVAREYLDSVLTDHPQEIPFGRDWSLVRAVQYLIQHLEQQQAQEQAKLPTNLQWTPVDETKVCYCGPEYQNWVNPACQRHGKQPETTTTSTAPQCVHKFRPSEAEDCYPGVKGICKYCGASATLEWIIAPAVAGLKATPPATEMDGSRQMEHTSQTTTGSPLDAGDLATHYGLWKILREEGYLPEARAYELATKLMASTTAPTQPSSQSPGQVGTTSPVEQQSECAHVWSEMALSKMLRYSTGIMETIWQCSKCDALRWRDKIPVQGATPIPWI